MTAHETDRHACNVLGMQDENGAGGVERSEQSQQKQPVCDNTVNKKQAVEIFPVDEERPEFCKHCGGTDLIKYGYVPSATGKHPKYKCKGCNRVFVYRAGAERMRYTLQDVGRIHAGRCFWIRPAVRMSSRSVVFMGRTKTVYEKRCKNRS